MKELLLHPTVESLIDRAVAKPPHALLITGRDGVGKESVARHVAAAVLDLDESELNKSSAFLDITPDPGEPFGIDRIRQAQHAMTLRSTTKGGAEGQISRVIFMSHANTMTKEAQNALLKLLEEPPKDGMLVLTAPSTHTMLTTISSRCQTLHVTKPDESALRAYLSDKGYEESRIDLAIRMGDGLPGLTYAMLDDTQEHPLAAATNIARQLIQQTAYERLCTVDALSKQRQQCLDICHILQQMAHLALQRTNSGSAERWKRIMISAYDCQQALERRVNTKLALTQLMVSL